MPRRIPKYRHFKPKNLGVVRLDGRDHYLGRYDSPESWEAYHRLIAQWLAGQGKPLPVVEPTDQGKTVSEVILAYQKFAKTYYVRDGEPTSELDGIRDSLRPLRQLYGSLPASEFGPVKLKTVRNHMIHKVGLCRTEINKRIGRIKRCFRWAASEELIPPSVWHGLTSVNGLYKGRTQARESAPVKPVADSVVDALLPFLPPQIVAMLKLQRLTGMRPGEVVLMRPCDIDRSGDVWTYRPTRHKNDWRGHDRAIALGPKAQAVLKPFLDRPAEAFLFSPQEANEWRLKQRAANKKQESKTPVYPCELRARERAKKARRGRRRKRPLGDHYTTRSYWRAVDYCFKQAKEAGKEVEKWTLNQLRHSRGTAVRKKFGIEASRVSLGHARLEATEIYAERNLELASQVAREMG